MFKTKQIIIYWVSIVAILLLSIEWIIGNYIDINMTVLITYCMYLLLVFWIDTGLVVEYTWFFVIATLNIFGIFICDSSSLYLVELFKNSYYSCALIPAVICYIVFFGTVEYFRIRILNEEKAIVHDKYIQRAHNLKLMSVVCVIGIALVTILFFRVVSKPYFLYGVTKEVYSRNYMTSIEKSLKSYLLMFVPVILIYSDLTKKRIYGVVFLSLLFAYYVWTGDKFGAHFFLIYIIIVAFSWRIPDKHKKKFTFGIGLAFVFLIAIVYSQQYLLFGTSGEMFKQYLSQRLSQQGEVWWAVYSQQKTQPNHLNEFWTELSVILPIKYNGLVGQWKMMVESSSNEVVLTRAKNGNPYTATTMASVYYYFKFPGLIAFYFLAGGIYSKIVSGLYISFKEKRVIEAVLFVRILSLFHNLLNSSDIYIVSIKGLMYIVVLLIIITMRRHNTGVRFGKGRII